MFTHVALIVATVYLLFRVYTLEERLNALCEEYYGEDVRDVREIDN